MKIKILSCRDCCRTLIYPVETKCKDTCRFGTVVKYELEIPDEFLKEYVKKLEAEQ